MFKAIAFDLDGTLITSPLCFKTIRQRLDIPEQEFILEYLECLPEPSRTYKLRELERIELDFAAHAEWLPDASAIVHELRQQGVHTGILTRNCRAVTELIQRNLALQVDMVIAREDAPTKPDPVGLLKMLNAWGVARSEMLFVGDFRFDIECGKNAGVATALYAPLEFTETHGADIVFSRWDEFFYKLKTYCRA